MKRFRLWLHVQFLDLAVRVMPRGNERLLFLAVIRLYILELEKFRVLKPVETPLAFSLEAR